MTDAPQDPYGQPQYPASGPPSSPVPYGQPPYYQPAYPPPLVIAQGPPTSGLAVASMVVGIVGAVGGWCALGIPCVVAIVLGHFALNATKNGQRSGRGMAIAGLVLGYLFVVPYALIFINGAVTSIVNGVSK